MTVKCPLNHFFFIASITEERKGIAAIGISVLRRGVGPPDGAVWKVSFFIASSLLKMMLDS